MHEGWQYQFRVKGEKYEQLLAMWGLHRELSY